MKIQRADWSNIAGELLDLADEQVLQRELPEVFQEDAQSLKLATSSFLQNIKITYAKILRFNEMKKVEHKIRELQKNTESFNESKIAELQKYLSDFKNLKIEENEFNFFISQLEKYQKSLNNYLGKKIETLYLYQGPDGTVTIYKLTGDLSKAVYQDIASRGGGMSARFSASAINDKTVFSEIKSSTAESRKLDESNSENKLTEAYLEALRRGEKSREIIKSKGMLILWKPAEVWKKMFVAGGAGDLGEAYLSFMMSEDRVKMFNSTLEWNIDIFMLQGVALVDNISGLLKGDFSANGIEYAAKAEGASVMGYRQVINLALEIELASVDQVVKIMQREYGKILRKEASGAGRRNKLAEGLSNTEEKLLADFASKIPGAQLVDK